MANHIHPTRTFLAVLIVAGTVSIGAGVPMLAHAAAGQANNKPQQANDDRRKIGEANDFKVKARDPLYAQQAKSLAVQYRETAQIVASHGGNPKPLLDAAAHLESQSALITKARQNPISVQIPEAAVSHGAQNKQHPVH